MRTRKRDQHIRRTSTLIERLLPIGEVEIEKILLTVEIGLPAGEALPDVLCFEPFSRCTVLAIGLQSMNNHSSLGVGEKLGVVWEVLDDPEG